MGILLYILKTSGFNDLLLQLMTQTIQNNLSELIRCADNILLLQGPVGRFFYQFSQWLSDNHDKTVHKFNFNGGDERFYPGTTPNTLSYKGTFEDFPTYLNDYIIRYQIQAIVCFGDTRPYHDMARIIAEENNVSFWVFEEGYFRPYFITLEKSGVNANSPLPREAAFFTDSFSRLPCLQYHPPEPVPGGFVPMAKNAIYYYIHTYLKRKMYPAYVHHRPIHLTHYLALWSMSALKRLNYWLRDYFMSKHIESGKYGRFFIVPLQVFNDSQIRIHCDFPSVRDFLLHVLDSFVEHAPQDTHLIIKHHPMDRGFIDYARDIRAFIHKHPQLKKRITYVHDVPLPVFLRHGVGMVTVNSTSGLSALIHNMPVKVLGRAHYDIPGITDQAPLAEFWKNPTAPDKTAFHAYRMYHINTTQINGNFYSKVNFPEIAPIHSNIKISPLKPSSYTQCHPVLLTAKQIHPSNSDYFYQTKKYK